MIELNDIFFAYDNTQVLKGINLKVEKGEIISIVGASGAGKTTLLHILGTLEKPQKGDYLINNKSINDLDTNKLAKFRNLEVGFIFQFHNLLVEFTSFENICLPGYISNRKRKEVEERALELLNILGISDKKDEKPNELSGGEQQRLAIARALINSPSIILADEPSGNLDSKNADELYQLLLRLNKEMSQTIIVITHNKELAKLAHRTLEIKDGKII